MPRYYATINCPACGNRFQAPIEQILDVRVDAEVKNRVMSGMVNVATCPACGMAGPLNLPFIYHDPEKEIALLYLPMSVGNSEVERQKAAGTLNRQLMESMPMEERKGYLLQPETFINLETLVKRVLELEGVTDEDMAHSQAQREFLNTFLSASEDEWETLLAENEALVDESFFAMLQYTLQMVAMSGQESEELDSFEAAYEYLVTHSKVGQLLKKRTEAIAPFSENPSRETLLQAFVDAPDEETIYVLVQSGMSLMDYAFFQRLVRRIESAEDPEEKARIAALRRKILEIRDEIAEQGQAVVAERAELLEKLLKTEDPLRMARSHMSELDDTFSFVLRTEIEEAQRQGNEKMFTSLQKIAQVLAQVMEENMPPQVVLARRLLRAPSEEQMRALLEQNKELLNAQFFQLLESLVENSRQSDNEEATEQLAQIRALAQQYAPSDVQHPQPAPEQAAPPTQQPPSSSETQTPSGLIIAKH